MKEGVKLKIGDKVRYIGYNGKRQGDLFSPPVGTVGEITYIKHYNAHDCIVKWPDGSIEGDPKYYFNRAYLELVESGTDDLETRVRLLEERLGRLEHIADGVIDILSSRK